EGGDPEHLRRRRGPAPRRGVPGAGDDAAAGGDGAGRVPSHCQARQRRGHRADGGRQVLGVPRQSRAGADRRRARARPPASEHGRLRAEDVGRQRQRRGRPLRPRAHPGAAARGRRILAEQQRPVVGGRGTETAMATLQTLPDATTFLPASGGAASPVAIRSILYAVFKHRRLVLGILALVFLGSAAAAFLRPRTWLASSKVLVKLGETVQLAPAEAPSRSVYLPLNQDVVKTEADIIKSQAVISEAVRRLGIEPEPGTDMDELRAAMQLATTVTQNPGGNILQINFLGRDPKRAARNANAITDVYIEHHNKVYAKAGMSDFYEDQLQMLEGQMNTAERRLKQFLAQTGIVDAETEIKLLAADEIEQDKGLQAHLAKISALRQKLATIKGQLAKTPEQIAWGREYTTNPTTLTYKNKLAELEVSRASVLQRYLANDRHVRDFDEQIGNLKGRLSAEQDKLLSKTTMRTSLLNMDLKRS